MRKALLFAPLMLAGCAMAPQPAPAPTLQLPAAWRSAPAANGIVARDWWQAFGDPQLNALVARALDSNGDLRIARSRLQEYGARVRVASSAEVPSLNLSVGPTRARAIGPLGQPVEVTSVTGAVQAAYELDLFGRLASTTAAARFDELSQEAALDAAALAVAANTASGYLNLLGLDAQLALARATLASRERSFALARHQFEVGYSSRLEMSQAEAELRATASVVPQLERAIAQQEQALNLLVGASPGPVARGVPLLELRMPTPAPGLPSELLRRRPDIAQAERAVAASDASLAAARDQLLPSIRLTASFGAQGHSLGNLLQSPTALWSIGGSILAPLFDAGRLRAQAEIAGTVRDRAVYTYENVVRGAFAETENALAGIDGLRRQLLEAEARRTAANEVLRVAHNRYANGYASYLEELDAQRNAFSAENTVLQLRASLLAAHVDLYRALGGGWTSAR
ncbi:efflux transporter outer membrane subunit [Massilia sp. 9I]|uniref:efflux transporter outer membrane subunit n=1 Tax=Massilia sp. 9I TaxID=2653152 RepID=UPI0012F2D691|nr:efflux transporter outer membrane subunit [Massilia sp. 9I]VXC76206.1 NodT family efflux transporter, outer membrane factor (OMF) lipoprotein [Massilia sp. 9I]